MKLTTLTKPGNFPLEIAVKNLAGDEVTIPLVGIGRTLRDWLPLALKRFETEANERLDASQKKQDASTATEEEDAPTKPQKAKRVSLNVEKLSKEQEESLDKAVAKVREFAAGWELDLEFTDENIKELIAQYPGIQGDGWDQYDARIKGHRTKN